MPHPNEFARTLRWMRENLDGAYNARHPAGHPHAGDHCTNSGTCLIACCYMNALGKVLLKGSPAKGPGVRRDFLRFREFVSVCMGDLVEESAKWTWPRSAKGTPRDGIEWLYEVYRCAFVHQAHPVGGIAKWRRVQGSTRYWFDHKGSAGLNIEGLVPGFFRGLDVFEARAAQDQDLQLRFADYLEAE